MPSGSIVDAFARRRLHRFAAAAVLSLAGPALAGASLPTPVWHVETDDGRVIDSRDGEVPINPASLVKVATTLWALERLGPGHRFVTRFELRAPPEAGEGPSGEALVVRGGLDPDFHVENAFLVAAALNRRGVRSVDGPLVVDRRFWIGWEGGSEPGPPDPDVRAKLMAVRLRDALDPGRWSDATRRGWTEFAARRGLDPSSPPGVSVPRAAAVGGEGGPVPDRWHARLAVEHRSNPLAMTLERFNAYSNNDIERLAATLGPPDELARVLFGEAVAGPRFATLSGLGTNRLTPGQVVDLLRRLRATCERSGLALDSVLPAAGCDPGTLQRFPRLARAAPGAVVAKTGTLVETDGGVAAMAGLLQTAEGDRWFCVAIPGSGRAVRVARRALEAWVLERLAAAGGPRETTCPPPPGLSDADARVSVAP